MNKFFQKLVNILNLPARGQSDALSREKEKMEKEAVIFIDLYGDVLKLLSHE